MDNPLTSEQQKLVIEVALYTYPTVPMPRDITTDVMVRIKTIPAPRSFRFAWNDLILAIVLSISIGALWFSINNLPPLIVAQIRKESILFSQQMIVNARWLIPALSFGLAAFFAGLTIPHLRRELLK